MNRFSHKVVLVTGAARGIGRATARLFAEEGATVVATDLDSAALAAEFDGANSIDTLAHDVGDPEAWQTVMDTVIGRHGRLDVLVNNAGIALAARVEDLALEDWHRVFAVDVDGILHGIRAGIAAMKESGGAIVNVSSITASVAAPELAAYGSAKAAVSQLSRTAAVDCGRSGYPIRINAIHPGFVGTDLVDGILDDLEEEGPAFAKRIVKAIPMGRIATPREIAKPILFLAGEEASYLTGTELVVDGGYTAG